MHNNDASWLPRAFGIAPTNHGFVFLSVSAYIHVVLTTVVEDLGNEETNVFFADDTHVKPLPLTIILLENEAQRR